MISFPAFLLIQGEFTAGTAYFGEDEYGPDFVKFIPDEGDAVFYIRRELVDWMKGDD